MGVETYYISRTKVGNFGTLFFLKQLQDAGSTGGGEALLGSVVPEVNRIFSPDYVVPQSLMAPKVLIRELEKNKAALHIDGDLTLKIGVAAGTETLKMEKKKVFQVGVGPFPIIPLNFGLDLDYSRMESLTINYGDGTFYEYIPLGYLSALHQMLHGEPSATMGGNLLKENAFISQILLAKNYTVLFESNEGFKTDFDAKLAAFNAIPAINGKVRVEKETIRTLKAEVSSPTYYVVAISSTNWEDCDPT